ncbi:MAG TPA: hypothetical protein VH855_12570 [Acetobacteraceae bacterium]
MGDIIQAVGPNPVMIRAVWVPPGGTLPGYPYEHIGQAVFIPDSDERNTPVFKGRQDPPLESRSRAARLSAPSRTVDSRAQQENALDDRRWSGPPLASAAGPWAPAVNPTGGNGPSGSSAPRRGVRSAQAKFSAAVPTPYVDASREAIDAAVKALAIDPADWDYTHAASSGASAIRPKARVSPLQLPTDSISAVTSDPLLVAGSEPQPIHIVSDTARERQPGIADVSSPPSDPGVAVILPNGSTVPDPYSATGRLMSPVADLAPVAAAGRQTGRAFMTLKDDPVAATDAYIGFMVSMGTYLGHGGVFDYQRRGNHITGFVQLRQFRDVSDFNVGLFCQQAGLSLDEALTIAGSFASLFSRNASPDKPYGLDPRTAEFIRTGYQVGSSGAYGAAPQKQRSQ